MLMLILIMIFAADVSAAAAAAAAAAADDDDDDDDDDEDDDGCRMGREMSFREKYGRRDKYVFGADASDSPDADAIKMGC